MPRTIEVNTNSEMAQAILERVQDMDGVVGLAYHRGASLDPAGDILAIQTTNDATRKVFEILSELDVIEEGSILTNEPRSLISSSRQDKIDRESNESTWDEMAFLLRQDTNIAVNYLSLMMLAGAIAAVGLWTDTLHVVIGAMVIAPAFEPLVRIPFGFIAGPREITWQGLISLVTGYLMLILGGVLAVLILQIVDQTATSDLETRSWIRYWSTVTGTGVLTSAFGSAAGALVITAQRSVLTTGVMIALALIPSLTIVGMALVTGDVSLAGRGFVRWAVDAGLVVSVSAIVLWLKHVFIHNRKALS